MTDFNPNLTPRDIFKLGSFGGTYWRPIYSNITKKKYNNVHKKLPAVWWKGIPEEHLSNKDCNNKINKYNVRVGTSLEFWEEKNWINKSDPYGWVQWYCNFYNGRRTKDDERQIKRWLGLAGENGNEILMDTVPDSELNAIGTIGAENAETDPFLEDSNVA